MDLADLAVPFVDAAYLGGEQKADRAWRQGDSGKRRRYMRTIFQPEKPRLGRFKHFLQAGEPGSPVELEICGQRLTAVFAFEQMTTQAGNKVIRIGFTEVSIFIGDDKNTASPADDIGIALSQGAGSVLAKPGVPSNRIR